MSNTFVLRGSIVRALPFALALLTAVPAAASPTTDVFLANVRVRIDVLAESSRAAAAKAQSDALKRFAADEASHQRRVLAGLDRWWGHEDAARPAEVASLPLATGRSVAVDPPAETFAPPPGIGVLMTGASAQLESLSRLDGAAFDDAYKATQRGTLKTLEGLYDTYAHIGDDAALRDMAARELAEVRDEIAALDRI
ncbi:putative membrane protein [Beijerinckiaceae bacterium RH AL1]|nr:DUF4142 domain-containing protein [Beijerinckiaceae bacterium]VVB45308.1 putative membrane protein [Beijerinckiaceae bacterium RH CH11]VVB45386.1 putative membrane protein [Beijerinckiaceae bacterium RH AL8]VVC54800.1 putative membrane protein [Beijerinckiaceae bacterium RH AL1]